MELRTQGPEDCGATSGFGFWWHSLVHIHFKKILSGFCVESAVWIGPGHTKRQGDPGEAVVAI